MSDHDKEDGSFHLDDDIPQDIRERRLHLRAYDYWASLLDGRDFPSVADLKSEDLDSFRENSFLIDFPKGYGEPVLRYVGAAITETCGGESLRDRVATDVPANCVLSRLAPHYMEVLANKAPIGFEAEFQPDRDREILYRGILLPLSDDNESIHFILGAISWKERTAETASAPPAVSKKPALEPPDPAIEETAGTLYDLLAECRTVAGDLVHVDSRTRNALYEALAKAFAFFDAAAAEPDAYQEILKGAGIKQQVRAPFTPVIKLVFGADYDKTRITEYATALCYVKREGRTSDNVKSFIASHEGGIKGCVKAERKARRAAKGNRTVDRLETAKERMRALAPLAAAQADWVAGENEFALALTRRSRETGRLEVIKILDEKEAVLESILKRAAQK